LVGLGVFSHGIYIARLSEHRSTTYMIASSYGQSFPISQSKQSENGQSIADVAGKSFPFEKNNSDTVQISEATKSKMLEEIKNGGFIDFTGDNGLYRKGLMMGLGVSTVQEWSDKGIKISEEAVIAAGKSWDSATNKMFGESGTSSAGSSLALNKHQIVINSQEVPDWFTQEYESVLSSMDNKEMRSAFEKGDLFFTSKPSSLNGNALASYASVAKNI
jgi:hypothetical protein